MCYFFDNVTQFVPVTSADNVDDDDDDVQRSTTVWRLTSDARNCTTLMLWIMAARWENCQLMEQLIAYWSMTPTLNHELLCLMTRTGARALAITITFVGLSWWCVFPSQMFCRATFKSSVVLGFGWSLFYSSSIAPQRVQIWGVSIASDICLQPVLHDARNAEKLGVIFVETA